MFIEKFKPYPKPEKRPMTTITSIPTIARGAVRAFIKGQPDFQAYLNEIKLDSRDVRNEHLLEYARKHGLMTEVQRLIVAAGHAPHAKSNELIARAVALGDLPPPPKVVAVTPQPVVDAVIPEASAGKVFALGDVLTGMEQLLSPLVRVELERALAPIIDAANKPALEVERIVTLDAKGKVVATRRSNPVKTGKMATIKSLFGLKDSRPFVEAKVSLWDAHGAAPAIDPFYVVDPVNMALVATAAESNVNVWQVGPSGSGKTTQPEQFAAATGRPFTKIACTKHTEVADLVGGDALVEGETRWQDGALIAAMRIPGMVILIDEPTLASPGVQAIFQNVTDDHRSYTIHSTGEVVRAAQGVFFVVADNTNGSGDETGQYAGTYQANGALINRFKRMVRVEYMTRAQEVQALVNHTAITKEAAAQVVDFFITARRLPEMEGVIMSLRQMVGFVGVVKDGFPSKVAMEVAILNKLPATERAAIEALATLQWANDFDKKMHLPAQAQTTQGPSSSPAARAFDDDVSASLNSN